MAQARQPLSLLYRQEGPFFQGLVLGGDRGLLWSTATRPWMAHTEWYDCIRLELIDYSEIGGFGYENKFGSALRDHPQQQAHERKGFLAWIAGSRPVLLGPFSMVWRVTFRFRSAMSWGAVLATTEVTF